jgi:PPOX class probable F420-dependent enzyme
MSSITSSGGQSVAPHLHRYLSVTAFTPDEEAVAVNTWFVAHNGRVYVRQPAGAAIVGAVRQNGRVTVQPTGRSGEGRGLSVAGWARIVPQFETYEPGRAIDQKYGIVAGMSHVMSDNQGLGGEVLIEIMLDPGPGTDDLLREAIPEAEAPQVPVRGVLIGVGVALGLGAFLLLRRRRRRARMA